LGIRQAGTLLFTHGEEFYRRLSIERIHVPRPLVHEARKMLAKNTRTRCYSVRIKPGFRWVSLYSGVMDHVATAHLCAFLKSWFDHRLLHTYA
jgi:hypothetical protein